MKLVNSVSFISDRIYNRNLCHAPSRAMIRFPNHIISHGHVTPPVWFEFIVPSRAPGREPKTNSKWFVDISQITKCVPVQ